MEKKGETWNPRRVVKARIWFLRERGLMHPGRNDESQISTLDPEYQNQDNFWNPQPSRVSCLHSESTNKERTAPDGSFHIAFP